MTHGSNNELLKRLERIQQFRDVVLAELQIFPFSLKRQIIRGLIEELAILHDMEAPPCRRQHKAPHGRRYCEGCGRTLKDLDFRKINGREVILEMKNRAASNGHDPIEHPKIT